MQSYDLICLGAGSGGLSVAERAAKQGAKVALIEAQDLGGTCVNLGCVPKKIIWYGAQLKHDYQAFSSSYGLSPLAENQTSLDWGKLKRTRNHYIAGIQRYYQSHLEQLGIDYFHGYGTLVDSATVCVNEQRYQAKYIVLATGSKAIIPEIDGAQWGLTSDDFFQFNQLPHSIAIVGSGYIAVEFACMLASFGVEVHLLMRGERPLRHLDSDLSAELAQWLPKLGIHCHYQAQVKALIKQKQGCFVCLEDQPAIEVEHCLWAIGRTPALPKNSALAVDDSGYVCADACYQTSLDHVYAVGDLIASGANLTPVAIRQGRDLGDYLFAQKPIQPILAEEIPSVIFTHPALATIGLTETQAKQKHQQIKCYSVRFHDMQSAVTSAPTPCYLKLVCAGSQELVVGLHGFGRGVDEILQGFAVAMKLGATKKDFDQTIAIHPTIAEEFVTLK